MNTTDYLLEVGHDDDIAIITARGSHTYRDLRAATDRIAHQLLASASRWEIVWASSARTRSSGWPLTWER